MRLSILPLLGKLMPAGVATAALLCAASLPAAPPDYARGFDLLFELGLVDLSGPAWEYKELEGEDHSREPFETTGRLEADTAVLTLNKVLSRGWVEKMPGDATPKFQKLVMNGREVLGAANDNEAWPEMHAAGLQWTRLSPGKKPADEKADALALVAGIEALGKHADHRRNLSYNADRIATLFFRAAQHHRRGFKEEAAAAVAALLPLAPEKERVLDLVMQKLAEDRYRQTMRAFGKNRDWKALEAALASQLGLFTRGWQQRPAVQRLHTLVKARLATAELPPLPGAASLTPEQVAWWNLASNPEMKEGGEDNPVDLSQLAQVWLYGIRMESNPDTYGAWKEHLGEAPAWARAMLEKDWDWYTVMAAAVGDDTMVPQPAQSSYDQHSYTSFDLNSAPAEPNEEEMEEMWRELNRPGTRGDLARAFLQQVLPFNDEQGDDFPTDPEELRRMAQEASKALHGKPPLEVARHYLVGGGREQRSQAMLTLIRLGDDNEVKKVEATIFESPSSHFETATAIVRKRKAEGKAFLAQYRKALVEEQKSRDGSNVGEGKDELPDYMKDQFAALEALTSGRGIEEITADFATGKLDRKSYFRQAQSLFSSPQEADKAVDTLLQAVSKVPREKGDLKWLLLQLCMRYSQQMTDARKELLSQILKTDGDIEVDGGDGESVPLASYVYWTADYLTNAEEVQGFRETLMGLPASELWPFWIARGKMVLEGGAKPEPPSADKVPEARRKELLAAVDQHLEQGWPEYVSALTLDEKLALSEDLEKAEWKPAWSALTLRITKVKGNKEMIALLGDAAALQGRKVSAASLVKLSEASRSAAASLKEGEGIRCSLSFQPLLQGMQLNLASVDPESAENSLAGYAYNWMQQTNSQSDPSPALKGASWLTWSHGARANMTSFWHLDKEAAWQPWNNATDDTLGRAPAYGEFAPADQAAKLLEERLKELEGKKEGFWLDTGAVKAPAPAPEAP